MRVKSPSIPELIPLYNMKRFSFLEQSSPEKSLARTDFIGPSDGLPYCESILQIIRRTDI
jgi:hypothetical protein